MLIKLDIAKPRIKQSPAVVSSRGRKSFPQPGSRARARAWREESGERSGLYGGNSANERAIDSRTSSRQKRKETNQDGALLTSPPHSFVLSPSDSRKAFGNYSTLSFSLAFHLPLLHSSALAARSVELSAGKRTRINIKRIQYLRIRT